LGGAERIAKDGLDFHRAMCFVVEHFFDEAFWNPSATQAAAATTSCMMSITSARVSEGDPSTLYVVEDSVQICVQCCAVAVATENYHSTFGWFEPVELADGRRLS